MAEKTEPPTKAPENKGRRAPSIVIVNTGDGKGKTTAAMGTILRSLARDWKVLVVQFIKSGNWHSGEVALLEGLGAQWWVRGDGFSWDVDDLDHSADLARATWEDARKQIESGEYQLVLLDEVTYPINWGWIAVNDVVATIKSRPEHVNVIITGRDTPEEITAIADTVTEMRNVRHAFDSGIHARSRHRLLMALTVLLGGARSGKSNLAVKIVSKFEIPATFIATGTESDDEMTERIRRHRDERPPTWTTIEEPVHIERELVAVDEMTPVIIDCLTLWVANLLMQKIPDDEIEQRARKAAMSAAKRIAPTVVVSNEVGSGIVPNEPLARRYQDLLGKVNTIFASSAERVMLVVAGRVLPLAQPDAL